MPDRIFHNGRVPVRDFVFVADDALLPAAPAIVSLKRFLAEKTQLLSRAEPVGVRLESSESPELLASDLGGVALIELHMPYLRDGRPFSWARLLRTRLKFNGEIRLTGHFLLDQMAFFLRVGVDSFTLPEKIPAAEISRAVGMISNVYQPAPDGKVTIGDLRLRTTALAAE
jgi:uncharacterized protein (DUF934 family)